jgi:hypothetical protein
MMGSFLLDLVNPAKSFPSTGNMNNRFSTFSIGEDTMRTSQLSTLSILNLESPTHSFRSHAMKTLTALSFALLACAGSASAAILSTGATYSYSVAPGFSGGTFYLDDIHGSTLGQLNTPFAAGDLNDGLVHPNSNPTAGPANTMLAWDPTPLASTITFDLGANYSVSEVTVTTFAFSSFSLGTADDVTISFSFDNVSYSLGTLYSWADAGNGSNAHATGASIDAARYVRLAFDGSTTTGDKWGLTEITIEGGAPIPEPSTALLMASGLVGLAMRRRRRK